MTASIGVAIPSIPPRAPLLARALASVCRQTRLPEQISVVIDDQGLGAPITRTAAYRALDTDFVAFLDDDDEMKPGHLKALLAHQVATGADLVYPWFDVAGGTDPFPQYFDMEWSAEGHIQTTITFLCRKQALDAVGGFVDPSGGPDFDGHRRGEDYETTQRIAAAGYQISHLAERTWVWHHDGALNLSGLSWRNYGPEVWTR